jgi:hypothetical protein
MHHDSGLIVCRSPAVESAIAFDRLEGIVLCPSRKRSLRLYIVVSIEQHRGFTRSCLPMREHRGAPLLTGGGDKLDNLGVQAALSRQGCNRLGTAAYLALVE